MLVFFVENPPVATVPNEWQILSNKSIPPRVSRTISDMVLGRSFCLTDDSSEKRLYPPTLSFGRTIITSRIMPIPPIQCVRLRQKSIDLGRLSTFVNIEAPVVVNPDTVSNRM